MKLFMILLLLYDTSSIRSTIYKAIEPHKLMKDKLKADGVVDEMHSVQHISDDNNKNTTAVIKVLNTIFFLKKRK